jgi:hypothetical protein
MSWDSDTDINLLCGEELPAFSGEAAICIFLCVSVLKYGSSLIELPLSTRRHRDTEKKTFS